MRRVGDVHGAENLAIHRRTPKHRGATAGLAAIEERQERKSERDQQRQRRKGEKNQIKFGVFEHGFTCALLPVKRLPPEPPTTTFVVR